MEKQDVTNHSFDNGFRVIVNNSSDEVIVSYNDKKERYKRSDFTDEQLNQFLLEIKNTKTIQHERH